MHPTCITKVTDIASSGIIAGILSGKGIGTEYYEIPQPQLWEGDEAYLRITGSVTFSGDPLQSILAKMVNAEDKHSLGDLCNTLIGLESSLDEIYIVDEKDIQQIIRGDDERKYFKPFYKNSDSNCSALWER